MEHKKIIKYTLVIERFIDIEDKVNEMIKCGWQPIGSLCNSTTMYIQAMVKYEDDEQIYNTIK